MVTHLRAANYRKNELPCFGNEEHRQAVRGATPEDATINTFSTQVANRNFQSETVVDLSITAWVAKPYFSIVKES